MKLDQITIHRLITSHLHLNDFFVLAKCIVKTSCQLEQHLSTIESASSLNSILCSFRVFDVCSSVINVLIHCRFHQFPYITTNFYHRRSNLHYTSYYYN